ncbi:MAG TPA: EAL domain-containing protein [Chloroflexota bacterium]|nr:EAL domain-containing protein [Chloroflexota bacterium]
MARFSPRAERGPSPPPPLLPASAFEAAFDLAAAGMAILSLQGSYLRVNPALRSMFGYQDGEEREHPIGWLGHPDDPPLGLDLLARLGAGETGGFTMERRCLHREGHWLWAHLHLSAVRDGVGAPTHFIAQWVDIQSLKQAREAVRASEDRFRTLVETAPMGVMVVDAAGTMEVANAAAQRILGFSSTSPGSLAGHLRDICWRDAETDEALSPESMVSVHALIGEPGRGRSVRFRHPGDATERWATTRSAPLRGAGGRIEGALAVVTDATREQTLLAELARLAHHDVLTGLPNRRQLHETVGRAIGAQENQPLSLLLIDLGDFKEVNDTLGHEAGDAVLREVGRRLRAIPRENDMVARLGGDEFAVLLPSTGRVGAEEVAQMLLQAIQTPIMHDGRSVEVSASVGIGVFPEHGSDASTLLRHADVALSMAKQGGGGVEFYAASRDENSVARLSLGTELRTAISEGQLRLCYQPLISLSDGAPVGVECLVRWEHPERGLLGPMAFVPKAERTGLIGPLTAWVLEEALRQQRAWRREGINCDISVNLSARSFHDEDLPSTVMGLLERYGAKPESLTLEVTESVAMEDPEQAIAMLQRLGKQGVRLSIDDFGTGHSSLGYLQRLPVHQLKIDRSFLANIMADAGAASIVSFIMGLGQSLDLEIVVEGVETAEVTGMVTSLGFDLGQGYYFGRPMPAEALAAWWREHAASASASMLTSLHGPRPAAV